MTAQPRGEPIGVTVIGGYLGAGKTSLLNALLRTATEPTAVIVNDFGAINIDADLIAGPADDGDDDSDDVIALTNGCICCSLVDGFAAALDQVRSSEVPPRRLLIEASGVGDPGAIAAYAYIPGLELDLVLCLADVETIADRVMDDYVGDTARAQLAAADLVVLTKTDLLPDGAQAAGIATAFAAIERSAPGTRIVIEDARAPSPDLLVHRPDTSPRPPEERHRAPRPATDAGQRYERWAGRLPQWSREQLERTLAALPDSVLRMKGFVTLDDGTKALVQVAGRRREVTASVQGDRPDPSDPAVVAIGLPGMAEHIDTWIAEHRIADDSSGMQRYQG